MTSDDNASAETKKTDILGIVREDPELQSLLKGRTRAILVEPNISDLGHLGRGNQAVVGIYDYVRGLSTIALVDSQEEKVLATKETFAQFQLSKEEKEEAETLVAGNDRARTFLRGRRMNPLTRLYFPPEATGDEASHRFAIVFLRPNNTERRYAIVDLSIQKVVDMLTPEDLTAE